MIAVEADLDKPPLLPIVHEAMDLLDIVIRDTGNPRVRERAVWSRNKAAKAATFLGSPRFVEKMG